MLTARVVSRISTVGGFSVTILPFECGQMGAIGLLVSRESAPSAREALPVIAAVLSPVRVNVLSSQGMAMNTRSLPGVLGGEANAAKHVDPSGHGFEMEGIYARPRTAEVVDGEVVRNGALCSFIGVPMGKNPPRSSRCVEAKNAVPTAPDVAGPNPALRPLAIVGNAPKESLVHVTNCTTIRSNFHGRGI